MENSVTAWPATFPRPIIRSLSQRSVPDNRIKTHQWVFPPLFPVGETAESQRSGCLVQRPQYVRHSSHFPLSACIEDDKKDFDNRPIASARISTSETAWRQDPLN